MIRTFPLERDILSEYLRCFSAIRLLLSVSPALVCIKELSREMEHVQGQLESLQNEITSKEKRFKSEMIASRDALTGEFKVPFSFKTYWWGPPFYFVQITYSICDFQAREVSLLGELRTREQQLKDAENRSSSLEQDCNMLRLSMQKLQTQVSTIMVPNLDP